jgi:hypothetical protein
MIQEQLELILRFNNIVEAIKDNGSVRMCILEDTQVFTHATHQEDIVKWLLLGYTMIEQEEEVEQVKPSTYELDIIAYQAILHEIQLKGKDKLQNLTNKNDEYWTIANNFTNETIMVLVKQGWFPDTVHYQTQLELYNKRYK